MFAFVYELSFLYGEAAPKEEHYAVATAREFADGGVGEEFPSVALVRPRLMGAHGECGVEKQDALFGPSVKVARTQRHIDPKVGVDLFDDVDERGRHGYTLGY